MKQIPLIVFSLSILYSCAALQSSSARKVSDSDIRLSESLLVRQICESFWIHKSTGPGGVQANGLVAELPGGLLIVDFCWNSEQAEDLLNWAEARWEAEWIGGIVTHNHADRIGGVRAALERGIEVRALVPAVEWAGMPGANKVLKLHSSEDADFHDWGEFETYYPGPGHSFDNVVVWFSGPSILFGGCLLKSGNANSIGFVGDADLNEWPRSVQRVQQRYPEAKIIVPGHGQVGAGGVFEKTQFLLSDGVETE